MVSVFNLIKKQPRWSIVVGDENVRIAIVINITERGAATDFQKLKLRTNLIYYLNKTPLPGVTKKLIRLAQRKRILLRTSSGSNCTAPFATNKSSQPSLS